MTEESIVERLKKAAAGANGPSAAKPAQPASQGPAATEPTASSEDEIRRQAYEKAMGKSFINKEGFNSVKGQLGDNFNLASGIASTLFHGSVWTYKHVMRPVGRGITWPARATVSALGGPKNIAKAINRWTHPEDDKGKRHLSINRAGIVVATGLATVFAGAAIVADLPHIIGATADDVAVSAVTGVWYGATHEHIKMVMNTSQMDSSAGIKGMVEGSTSLPATPSNSWHLVVDDTGFHELHSLLTGNGFFDPRRVVSPVANTYNLCEVDIYGSPVKFLYSMGMMNPRLISVTSCSPMRTDFDPAYTNYINKILHSPESLDNAILHTPAPSTGNALAVTPLVTPLIGPK
jgi:hypothetical protein